MGELLEPLFNAVAHIRWNTRYNPCRLRIMEQSLAHCSGERSKRIIASDNIAMQSGELMGERNARSLTALQKAITIIGELAQGCGKALKGLRELRLIAGGLRILASDKASRIALLMSFFEGCAILRTPHHAITTLQPEIIAECKFMGGGCTHLRTPSRRHRGSSIG